MEWGTYPLPSSPSLCLLLSLSLNSHHISPMASNFDNSLVGTIPLLPPEVPRWWQPATRWVAVLHLPVRLHLPVILAPLVAQFGSLVSLSYPSNFKDKKILMILVSNCFISKVPHILPVREGDRVFLIRLQVVFQPKISGEGIIFDPMYLGDSFCSFFSTGQIPVNPVLQNGPALPSASPSLNHARDKRKRNTIVNDVDMSLLQSNRGASTLIKTFPYSYTMFCSSTNNNPLGTTRCDQALNPNPLKLTGNKAPTFESYLSSHDESHREDSLGRVPKRDPTNKMSLCQDIDISVNEKSHLLSISNGLTKTNKLLPVITSDSHNTISSAPCQEENSKYPKLVDIKDTEVLIQPTIVISCESLIESSAPMSEKRKLCRYANPPKVYRRRSTASVSVLVPSQQKASITATVQESSEHPTKQVVGNLGEFGGKI